MDEMEGQGSAEDAAISTEPQPTTHEELALANRVVESAEEKVRKQRDHLAGAEQALEAAYAARSALGEA